jgi:hypothetical protein
MSTHTATRAAHPASYNESYMNEESAHITTGWVGWIGFAGLMMMLAGIFQAISGLVGIFSQSYFAVANTSNQLLVIHNVHAWGWFNLIMGSVILAAGISLFSGSIPPRAIAVTLAMFSAIANLVAISLYPVWSIICLTLAILVIYAVVVHGGELREE